MKIKTIEIENFRAFYGKHTIEVNSKNMLIYGENGSGKSSLYWAVHDFFRSAYKSEDIEFKKNEWNLLDSSPQQSKINITFDEYDKPFSFTPSEPTPQEPKFINQVGKQNPFFTYRRLLKTYIEDKNIEKRIFDLLVNDILGNIQSNDNTTLSEFWWKFTELRNKKGRLNHHDRWVQSHIKIFNEQLKDNVNKLIDITNYYLKEYFNNNITLKIETPEFKSTAKSSDDLRTEIGGQYNNAKVKIEVKLFDKTIKNYQLFLNEARLSALSISMYLASLKIVPAPEDFKILFLDDIFIGLDTANRLPLLEILKEKFLDWQIFITTYDRHWFEIAKNNISDWQTAEIYIGKKEGTNFETPIVISNSETPYQKAVKYFNKQGKSKDSIDYPATGNYLRKECENLLKEKLYGKYLLKKDKKTGETLLKKDITELFISFEKMINDLLKFRSCKHLNING